MRTFGATLVTNDGWNAEYYIVYVTISARTRSAAIRKLEKSYYRLAVRSIVTF